jgi:hypothetical protein
MGNTSALVIRHRKLLLTQDYGFELPVTVAEFQVEPRDKTAYPWEDATGKLRELEMPPYYIIGMEQCERSMKEYSQRSYIVYIQRFLRGSNPLISKTFQEAIRYSIATRVGSFFCLPFPLTPQF